MTTGNPYTANMSKYKSVLIFILIIFLNINIVNAQPYNMGYENEIYIKYPGSGIHYIYLNGSAFYYLGVRDISYNIPNLKSRWVEFRINKNGDTIRIERCYNYDYCTIGNIKIKINWIFEGKEALATQFKVMKVYS